MKLRPLFFWAAAAVSASVAARAEPLRVLIAGMSHGHVAGFLKEADPNVVTIVGVWEPTDSTWAIYSHRLSAVPRYTDLEQAVTRSGAEAVWAFSDTREHLNIVRAAAPHHLAVIVEKPLATTYAAAAEMARLAAQYHTLVLTNYETSWYVSFADARQAIASGRLGPLRQVYFYIGHQGPAKIGVGPEFMAWLTDPDKAGGGALFDFGCYGANVATWWLHNRAPLAVFAATSHFDRKDYPRVDDHAVIDLVYPHLQVTVTASWHWPYNRKDAALYGENGALITRTGTDYGYQSSEGGYQPATPVSARRDPIRWFADAIHGGSDPVDDPSSLATNLITMEILEAARRSAAEHRAIPLREVESAAMVAPVGQ